MGRRRRDDKSVDAPKTAFNNPFAALGGASAGESREAAAPPPPAPARPAQQDVPRRAVVRRERKGRRGKEVTTVELRGLPADALPVWLSELKRSLGCGGTVEEELVVLQGDHRERLRELLSERGVGRVSVS